MAEPGPELFHGLPARSLSLPNGDHLRVLLHGAHVVSWVSGGRERLYLSPRSAFDGQSAIRGGVPVCFPQFNQRGPLPKHGFARNLPWVVDMPPVLTPEAARMRLRLPASAATRQFWPQAFELTLTLELRPACLQFTLDVHNSDVLPLNFTGALHTYLAVDDIAAAQLTGLEGQPEWDALTDRHGRATGPLRFQGGFDRVYDAASQALVLHDGPQRVRIEQSPGWAQTVVWNPGVELAATLPDLPADGYAHMLCVEAAQVMQAIAVPAGGTWQGWQRLSLT
ncbi:MAG: D-hexose-6-phosphate mutarotase [Hylemonella sp.]|nr:D-hexose-6-phosphate mutarotase [Hylemonella sp.]